MKLMERKDVETNTNKNKLPPVVMVVISSHVRVVFVNDVFDTISSKRPNSGGGGAP